MKKTKHDLYAAQWHDCLLALVADGWVNSQFISQEYGWEPGNPSSVSKHLITHLLNGLRKSVKVLLSHTQRTPSNLTYYEPIQDCIVSFFRLSVMQVDRALLGVIPSDAARMHALLNHNEPIDREQDDRILRLIVKNLKVMKNHFDQVGLNHSTNQ